MPTPPRVSFMSIAIAIEPPLVPSARIAIQATGRVRFHVTGSAPTRRICASGSSFTSTPPTCSGFGVVT